jgi:hypothetical protein
VNEWIAIIISIVILLIQGAIGLIIRGFKEEVKEAKGTAKEARDMAISQEQRIINLEDWRHDMATKGDVALVKEQVTSVVTQLKQLNDIWIQQKQSIDDARDNLIKKHIDRENMLAKAVENLAKKFEK